VKGGDVKTRVRSNITAIVWKEKWGVHTLTNMQHPPVEVNFCDEYETH